MSINNSYYMRELKKIGFKFSNINNQIKFSYFNLHGYITTLEDLYILREIFIEQDYKFYYNENCVIWDIGMNVGYSSLFFSQFPNVISVYGYEPFISTYNLALDNIAANPSIKSKIIPNNFAISDKDSTETYVYLNKFRGSSGILGVTPNIQNKIKNGEVEYVKVQQLRASLVLESIKFQNPNVDIIIKMDCEGSEFKIIPELLLNCDMKSVVCMIIEWHQHDPIPIINLLEDKGFLCFAKIINTQSTGLIYSVNKKL